MDNNTIKNVFKEYIHPLDTKAIQRFWMKLFLPAGKRFITFEHQKLFIQIIRTINILL